MGNLVTIVAFAFTIFRFYQQSNTVFFYLTIILALCSFWSTGIMHNFAVNQAVKRKSYIGRFYDFTEREIQSVPNWITTINMVSTLPVYLMFIYQIVRFVIVKS